VQPTAARPGHQFTDGSTSSGRHSVSMYYLKSVLFSNFRNHCLCLLALELSSFASPASTAGVGRACSTRINQRKDNVSGAD
jgi:hypothetical protein